MVCRLFIIDTRDSRKKKEIQNLNSKCRDFRILNDVNPRLIIPDLSLWIILQLCEKVTDFVNRYVLPLSIIFLFRLPFNIKKIDCPLSTSVTNYDFVTFAFSVLYMRNEFPSLWSKEIWTQSLLVTTEFNPNLSYPVSLIVT